MIDHPSFRFLRYRRNIGRSTSGRDSRKMNPIMDVLAVTAAVIVNAAR